MVLGVRALDNLGAESEEGEMSEREIDWAGVNSALAAHLFHLPAGVDQGVYFSDTWEGMGKVVEAMEQAGWMWCICHGRDNQDKHCHFWMADPAIRESTCYADTAPRAVALAALRVVAPDVARELIDG